ncbi:MAG: DUF2996 domain-containing protein [Cyanobacteria bacterium P01_E01_bin.34]
MAEENQTPAEGKADAKPATPKTTAKKPAAKAAAGKKPAGGRPPKKAKAPEKPFAQAIAEDVIPNTITALKSRGVDDLELVFNDNTLEGKFKGSQRKFNVIFSDADFNSSKGFTYTIGSAPVSTIESFMIDERKVSADLLVFYIVQRLYAQQWV